MNGFYDYIPKLIEYCEKNKPERIFEYGCGLSTILLSKLYPESKIISVEHSLFWYLINRVIMVLRGCRNAKLFFVPNMKKFINFPNRFEKQDIYFLDSPNEYEIRKECLKVLKEMSANVIVHDAVDYLNIKKSTYIIGKG